MIDRTRSRSETYQFKILEVPWEDEFLSKFTNEESYVNTLKRSEEQMDLYEKFKKRFWELAKERLTDQQYRIIRMRADGYTQAEIAKEIGINQSSCTKSMHGNVAYETKYENGRRTFGGSFKKIRKICLADTIMQQLMTQMVELTEEV